MNRGLERAARGTYRGSGPSAGAAGAEPTPEMAALRKQVWFKQAILPYTTTPVLILPQTSNRVYLLVQNLSGVQNLLLGFNLEPTVTQGLVIAPGAAYEPESIPQNDIYIIGDGAGTLCLIYAIA